MSTVLVLAVTDAFWLFLGVVLNALIVAAVPLVLRRLARMERLAGTTHKLVNSQMTDQKRLTAVSARTLANATNDPKHIARAEAAELSLAEHEAEGRKANATNGHP